MDSMNDKKSAEARVCDHEETCACYVEGYAQGKDKAHFEVRNARDGNHASDCCCEPCKTVRAVLGIPQYWESHVDGPALIRLWPDVQEALRNFGISSVRVAVWDGGRLVFYSRPLTREGLDIEISEDPSTVEHPPE